MSDSVDFHPLGNAELAEDSLEGTADIDPRLTRTNYFDGRLLKARDLVRDQRYLDQRVREVGQSLGSGILEGLELTFTTDPLDKLELAPGIGVTGGGRILELQEGLEVELDRARISELNGGLPFHFNRGLYAVVLVYAEEGKRIAEVFPQDLGAERSFNFDVVAEGVQLGLVQLPQVLPQQRDPLLVRAQLAREYYLGLDMSGVIPEDSVALGVLAVRDDRPQWLDAELLRRPLRGEEQLGDQEQDLYRHYQVLFRDVMSTRRSGSLDGDFSARRYFQLLPPVGTLPKDAINPAEGRQSFFPEACRVSIAPIRRSDVELVRAESMSLPAMDLASDEPADIMILAPLSSVNFGQLARRLEREFDAGAHRLPYINPLRLRVFSHSLDTDAVTWQAIWDLVQEDELLYVRRPLRAAETAVSGIVLAQGTVPPAVPAPPAAPLPAVDEPRLLEEGAAALRYVGIEALAAARPPTTAAGRNNLRALLRSHGDDVKTAGMLQQALLRVERRYDGISWQTLRRLVLRQTLDEFIRLLNAPEWSRETTSSLVRTEGGALGIPGSWRNQWVAVDES